MINYFRKEASSKMFDYVLNTPLWLNPEAVVQKCFENFVKFCETLICTLKAKAKPGIMFASSKVIDQLITATLLKINSIIDSSSDLPGF